MADSPLEAANGYVTDGPIRRHLAGPKVIILEVAAGKSSAPTRFELAMPATFGRYTLTPMAAPPVAQIHRRTVPT